MKSYKMLVLYGLLILLAPLILSLTNIPQWINDNVPTIWVAAIIVYLAITVPQYSVIHALEILQARSNGDSTPVKAPISGAVIIWNDIKLLKFFGYDTLMKSMVYAFHLISLAVTVLTIIYVNLAPQLVIWTASFSTDIPLLIVKATPVIRLVEMVAISTYLATKTIVIGYFIYALTENILLTISAVIHPIGCMIVSWASKVYLRNLEKLEQAQALGIQYEEDFQA